MERESVLVQDQEPSVKLEVYNPYEWEGMVFFVDERMSFYEDTVVLEIREFKRERVILCTSVLE